MPNLPKEIVTFKDKYGIDSDEIWEVRGGAYAIKHKALERVALAENIKFDPPQILSINLADKTIAMCVTGRQGERTEWTTGEAAPYNNKNGYPVAMAEKRARDRVILKLLQAHGALYSEDEADEFKQNGGHVTLPKKDAKEIYTKMQAEVRECQSREQLKMWGEANKDRIKVLPEDWQDILRLQYEEMAADLRNREAA
jgi:hypothetical protein